MKVISLLPSATGDVKYMIVLIYLYLQEILCAIGGSFLLVGRSHEDNFPLEITGVLLFLALLLYCLDYCSDYITKLIKIIKITRYVQYFNNYNNNKYPPYRPTNFDREEHHSISRGLLRDRQRSQPTHLIRKVSVPHTRTVVDRPQS